eukprot:COSAG02_NODE_32995_length_507_cov_0.857843_2_plen_66_part_00
MKTGIVRERLWLFTHIIVQLLSARDDLREAPLAEQPAVARFHNGRSETSTERQVAALRFTTVRSF